MRAIQPRYFPPSQIGTDCNAQNSGTDRRCEGILWQECPRLYRESGVLIKTAIGLVVTVPMPPTARSTRRSPSTRGTRLFIREGRPRPASSRPSSLRQERHCRRNQNLATREGSHARRTRKPMDRRREVGVGRARFGTLRRLQPVSSIFLSKSRISMRSC